MIVYYINNKKQLRSSQISVSSSVDKLYSARIDEPHLIISIYQDWTDEFIPLRHVYNYLTDIERRVYSTDVVHNAIFNILNENFDGFSSAQTRQFGYPYVSSIYNVLNPYIEFINAAGNFDRFKAGFFFNTRMPFDISQVRVKGNLINTVDQSTTFFSVIYNQVPQRGLTVIDEINNPGAEFLLRDMHCRISFDDENRTEHTVDIKQFDPYVLKSTTKDPYISFLYVRGFLTEFIINNSINEIPFYDHKRSSLSSGYRIYTLDEAKEMSKRSLSVII